MLHTISRNEFINNAFSSSCLWTDLVRDSANFVSHYYFDDANVYYLSTNYGLGETITVFNSYSSTALEKAKKYFPHAICVSFAYSCDEYKQNDAETSCNITLHYRLLAPGESNQAKLLIKKINSKDDLEKYDNLYNFFLRENHGSRLVNYWTKNEHEFINGEKSIYLAYVDQNLPIGFAIVDFYKILNACDVSQIFIEDLFQKKGYGTQFLQLMVDELSDSCFEIYYSSVNIDNIASRKTAEKVGFGIVGYRMNINS